MTASITEARRSSEAFLLGLIGEDDEDEADLLAAAAGLHSNGADEETVFLTAKRSAMAQTPKTWARPLDFDPMQILYTWPIQEHGCFRQWREIEPVFQIERMR